MEFCGENQLTMVIQRGSDQLFGELITLKDQILMPIISHSAQCSPAPSSMSASSPCRHVQNTFELYDVTGSIQAWLLVGGHSRLLTSSFAQAVWPMQNHKHHNLMVSNQMHTRMSLCSILVGRWLLSWSAYFILIIILILVGCWSLF